MEETKTIYGLDMHSVNQFLSTDAPLQSKEVIFLKALSVLCMAFLFCGCAFGNNWSSNDTYRQIAVTGLIAYDLKVQTPRYLEEDRELNPLITKDNLDAYWGVCTIGHWLVSMFLDEDTFITRKQWQNFWIGAQAFTIGHNFSIE